MLGYLFLFGGFIFPNMTRTFLLLAKCFLKHEFFNSFLTALCNIIIELLIYPPPNSLSLSSVAKNHIGFICLNNILLIKIPIFLTEL